MDTDWKDERVAAIVARLEADGLRAIESDGTNTAYHCRKARLAPFGLIESLVSLWVVQGTVTPDHLAGHLDHPRGGPGRTGQRARGPRHAQRGVKARSTGGGQT